MKKFTKVLSLMLALSSITSITQADHLADRLLFSARLNGANIIPTPIMNNASGVAGLMLNSTRDTLYMNFSATGLSGAITGFHIHEGNDKTNGPVLLDLESSLSGNYAKAKVVVNQGLLSKLLRSEVYLAVHTAANPGGEMRGQIKLETDFGYYTEMDGAQQVPMNASTAKGVAAINLSLDGKFLEVKSVTDGLSGAIMGAHLHRGEAGTNGGLLVDLSAMISTNGRGLFGVVEIDDSIKSVFQNYVKMGMVYLNIHTMANPNGEVRGQIKYDQNLRFDARIDTTQITGNLNTVSSAIGAAKFSLNLTYDTLRYYIVASNLTGAIAAAHIHNAEPNMDGGVVFEFPTSAINGNVISGAWTKSNGLTEALISQLLYGNLYVAIHTAANPAGELRGQIFRLAREGFVADIDAMQSVPSSNSTATGSGIVSYDRDRRNLHYMITVSGLSGAINAAHFHKGIKGETGGVVYELNFMNNATFGYWTNMNSPAFNNTQSITFRRNDSVYVNFHTTNFPNGEVRGQFIRNYKNNGVVIGGTTGINNNFSNNVSLYPNPSIDNVNISFESTNNETITLNISDMNGRVVLTEKTDVQKGNNILNVETKDLSTGMYIISLSSDNGNNYRTKFIKK